MANAKLVTAKTIKAMGGIARLRTMKVDLYQGDQFYAGELQGHPLNFVQTSGKIEAFILKLNAAMIYQYFRIFTSPQTEAYIMSLYSDRFTGLYAHLKTLSSTAGKYEATVL
jgi:hypothetical protein